MNMRTRLVAAYREAGLSTRSASEKGCLVFSPYTDELLAYTSRGIGSRSCGGKSEEFVRMVRQLCIRVGRLLGVLPVHWQKEELLAYASRGIRSCRNRQIGFLNTQRLVSLQSGQCRLELPTYICHGMGSRSSKRKDALCASPFQIVKQIPI